MGVSYMRTPDVFLYKEVPMRCSCKYKGYDIKSFFDGEKFITLKIFCDKCQGNGYNPPILKLEDFCSCPKVEE